MAKVLFKRRTTAEIEDLEVEDGALVYNTDNGKTYMDFGDERIQTGGNADTIIARQTTEPTDEDIKLWINPDKVTPTGASNVVDSMEGTQTDKSPSVNAVKDYINGTVLYSNSTGTNGDVNLSENINGRVIEVFYYFQNSPTLTVCGSRKFDESVGKLITLGIGDGHYDSGSFYGKFGSYTVSENKLTVRTKGGYYYGNSSGFNNTENVLYITKVIAYE